MRSSWMAALAAEEESARRAERRRDMGVVWCRTQNAANTRTRWCYERLKKEPSSTALSDVRYCVACSSEMARESNDSVSVTLDETAFCVA